MKLNKWSRAKICCYPDDRLFTCLDGVRCVSKNRVCSTFGVTVKLTLLMVDVGSPGEGRLSVLITECTGNIATTLPILVF